MLHDITTGVREIAGITVTVQVLDNHHVRLRAGGDSHEFYDLNRFDVGCVMGALAIAVRRLDET